MTESTPLVTILMRSKNADWVIGQALAGLFSQDFKDFELLVIDSGSTDRTLEIVSRYPHRLVQIPGSEYFPGRVLNRGIEISKSPIIVFQNSDAVPLSNRSLTHLVRAFDDPAVQAAFGRQIPRPEADPWVRREHAESFPDAPKTPPWITMALPWSGMRRSAWEQHRFYTEAWGSEDTEWGQWAVNHGWKIAYVSEAIAMHSHNFTLKQLYSRRFIEGEADAFIYRRPNSMARAALRVLGSSLKDFRDCYRSRDWLDLPRAPLRRAVYHYAYLKGHELGVRRMREGVADATIGQRTALEGHESNRD